MVGVAAGLVPGAGGGCVVMLVRGEHPAKVALVVDQEPHQETHGGDGGSNGGRAESEPDRSMASPPEPIASVCS